MTPAHARAKRLAVMALVALLDGDDALLRFTAEKVTGEAIEAAADNPSVYDLARSNDLLVTGLLVVVRELLLAKYGSLEYAIDALRADLAATYLPEEVGS